MRHDYDKEKFRNFLQTAKEQEYKTANDNACMIATFVRRGKTPDEFIKNYTKPNSYNNALNAIKHYCNFLGVPRPTLKAKRRSPDSLIIAPKAEEMQRVLREIKELDVKTYLTLCATVGLLPQRLLKDSWSEIDFVNGFVNINE